ncbi:MAG: hypothetical protein PHW04_11395 [Candidatus Wallbacteria bacterium]|nr:hypothetical protein [Candidatus Wallbacteria bacterium]
MIFLAFSAQLQAEDDLSISGSKVFRIRKTLVNGSLSKFLSDYQDWTPGFKLQQSLQLQIDGRIGENATVSAYLDDSDFDQEDKFLTLNLKGPNYRLTLGDFKVDLPQTRYAVFNKKVQGIEATGLLPCNQSVYGLYTSSKGQTVTKLFRGMGNSMEYRLDPDKIPVIENSETVKVGSRTLRRGEDYLIENDEGRILIKTQILPIEPENTVTVSYEYEEGSQGYKRNLIGSRYTKSFDQNNNLILEFFGLVDNKDKKVTGSQDDPGAPAPISHLVGSQHLQLFRNGWRAILDSAFSEKDNDLLNSALPSQQLKESKSWHLELDKKFPIGNFTTSREERDPDFEIIGRKESYQYNDLRSYGLALWPDSSFRPSFAMLQGTRLIFQDLDLNINAVNSPITASDEEKDAAFSYDLPKKLRISGTSVAQNKRNLAQSIDSSDDQKSVTFNKNWKKIDLVSGVEGHNFRQNFRTTDNYDLSRYSNSVTYRYNPRSSFSLNLSDQNKEGSTGWLSKTADLGLLWEAFLGDKYQGNLTYNDRSLKDFLSNSENSKSIEGKLSFSPCEKLDGYIKYLHQNLIRLTYDIPSQTYLENPLLSKDFSFYCRISPRNNLEDSLSGNYKLQDRTDLGLLEAGMQVLHNKLNFHYGKNTISYNTSLINTKREITPAKNQELENGLQWYFAPTDNNSYTLSFTRTGKKDFLLSANNEKISSVKIESERFFSEKISFNLATGFDIIKRAMPPSERTQLASVGMQYKPWEKLSLGWDLENDISHKDTRRMKTLNRFRVNSKPKEDMEVSSYLDLVSSNDTEDYNSRMFNLEVTFRF